MLRNRESEVLFVDPRFWNTNIYEKKFVKLNEERIQKLCDIYHTWQTQVGGLDKSELYYAAKKEEIVSKAIVLCPAAISGLLIVTLR